MKQIITRWVAYHMDDTCKLIMHPDKTIVTGNTLIDDKPEQYGQVPTRERVLFDNRHVEKGSDWRNVIVFDLLPFSCALLQDAISP